MTKLIYLSDTYIYSTRATILQRGTNAQGTYIILDQTIFYPQWGGQPSDTGTISMDGTLFEVKMVRLNEDGVVYHYGEYSKGTFAIDDVVSLEIDREKRLLNARTHSAGHLIDVAMRNIWLASLKPMKWYHFPDGPYVEYSGNMEESIESIMVKLQTEIDRLVKQDIPMLISYDTDVKSPTGKTPRYARFEWYDGWGCGGTHVRKSGEIGKVMIRKIKMKDGNLRVGYSVES
jgi:Ser-tRNA(Ala) deacylase AlaX